VRLVGIEVGKIKMHFNLRFRRKRATIPKIGKLELARGVRQSWIKDQPDGEEQIALPDAILADQNDVTGERDIDCLKIPEVPNDQSSQSHAATLPEAKCLIIL
jgi:hypothetical protein